MDLSESKVGEKKKKKFFIHFTRELDVPSVCARSHSVGCMSPAPESCKLGHW